MLAVIPLVLTSTCLNCSFPYISAGAQILSTFSRDPQLCSVELGRNRQRLPAMSKIINDEGKHAPVYGDNGLESDSDNDTGFTALIAEGQDPSTGHVLLSVIAKQG